MRRTLVVLAASLGVITATTLRAETGPSLAPDSRCFELRTYTSPPGKLEALHARFREHTNALFRKHGMTIVGFWVPSEADKGAANTLVYLLAFPTRPRGTRPGTPSGPTPNGTRCARPPRPTGRSSRRSSRCC
jgi:hypothetical protein